MIQVLQAVIASCKQQVLSVLVQKEDQSCPGPATIVSCGPLLKYQCSCFSESAKVCSSTSLPNLISRSLKGVATNAIPTVCLCKSVITASSCSASESEATTMSEPLISRHDDWTTRRLSPKMTCRIPLESSAPLQAYSVISSSNRPKVVASIVKAMALKENGSGYEFLLFLNYPVD